MALPQGLSVDIGTFAIAAALTVATAFISRWSQKSSSRPRGTDPIYTDKDGQATRKSQEEYSTRIQTLIAAFAVFAGLAVSMAYRTFNNLLLDGWLHVGLWAFLILQRIQIHWAKHPVARYRLCVCEGFTFLSVAVTYTFALYSLFFDQELHLGPAAKALTASSLALSICGFLVDFTVPRRPVLFLSSHKVDGQFTVSALSRYTYTWPSHLLRQAAAHGQIEFADLPVLDHYNRAMELLQSLKDVKQKYGGSLLKTLVIAHRRSLCAQYTLGFLDSFAMVAPQLAMYQILRLLESRDLGENITVKAAFWVLGLGLLTVASSITSNAMWWINYGSFNIPLRAQLSALVFDKVMRKKDVKGISSNTIHGKSSSTLEGEPSPDGQFQPLPDEADKDAEDALQKTRQGIINLVGVDTKRISEFATLSFMFVGSFSRLAITFTFLGVLLGWRPLAVGVAVQLLSLPINIHFSKKYTDGQDTLMKIRDRKLAVLNEVLGGIRQIKFAALENQWQKKIGVVREEEIGSLWSIFVYDTVLLGLWIIGPVLLSTMTIITYALIHGGLPASIAFTTISLLSQIEGTLSFIPELTTNMLDALVSLKRIQNYIDSPEKLATSATADTITFSNAVLTWPADEETSTPDADTFVLRSGNIAFPKGELSVVSGRTGSGKSLLLAAILGEVDLLSGQVQVPQAPSATERRDDKANKSNWILPSSVAYVSQQPWIENASLKDNVLFGLPFDDKRYKDVISACALEEDIKIFPDGDDTELGAQGINISGGQKWRVTTARALYSRAGILVMDDIFSAVDAHVGKHIFEQALCGSLSKGRTRILVTHHVALCASATKYEVHLNNGNVEYAGAADSAKIRKLHETIDDEEGDESVDEMRLSKMLSRQSTAKSATSRRRESRASVQTELIDGGHQSAQVKATPKKFVEEEKREKGWVKRRVYGLYLQASGGWLFWFTTLAMFTGFEGLLLGRSWVLKRWTEDYETQRTNQTLWLTTSHAFYSLTNSLPSSTLMVQHHRTASHTSDQGKTQTTDSVLQFYVPLYLGFALAISVLGTFRYLWVFWGSIKASRQLFDKMMHVVLRANLRWLDTVPVGRILNRFTADFNQTDSAIAYSMAFALWNVMLVVGIVVAGMLVSPYVVIAAAILFGVSAMISLRYIAAAREVKRLESVAKSPIFDYMGSALAGISTIRAFEKQEIFVKAMFERIDAHARSLYYQWLLNRWLSFRLDIVGAIFITIVAALIVTLPGMDAALAGFALGFVLQFGDAVTFTLRNLSNVELGMNAAERIIEYCDLETEDEGGEKAPAHWPSQGALSVENLVVAYAPDLPPVLKGLSFDVKPKERIGVVGRTGAGKSSLTLALFRFLEARAGHVYIDGLDISKIQLHDLRSRLAIIPQDPVLFSGTVRNNLDPFEQHTDQELLDALDRVHLNEFRQRAISTESDSGDSTLSVGVAVNREITLSTRIAESGGNLSQGERQLLCLARAIVSRPKIMVLDEATSAVDKTTDALIQRSIREEFSDSTLIVIAHRLSTIADFDKILVMKAGVAEQFGTPEKLLKDTNGVFKALVDSSGEKEALVEIITRTATENEA